MFNKILACALVSLFLMTGLAYADVADVKKAVAELWPNLKVDSVRKAGELKLYEVQIGGDIIFADEKGSFVVVQGGVIDVKRRINLTEEIKNRPLPKIKFSELPLELAVKTVRGNGRRVFASFEDPNCGYCKRFAVEMAGVTDFTMYTFLYPILSPNSTEKSKAIWCSADKAKSWNEWMVHGIVPAAANCDTPIDQIMALGQKLNVHGTPALFFSNGERIPGYLPAARLEQELNRIASIK